MRVFRIGLVVLVLVSLHACRIKPTEFSKQGGYVGGSVMYAFEDFDDLDPSGGNDSDEVFGIGVRAGYRIAPWVAAELAYEKLDEFDLDVAEVDVQTLMLQGKAYPFTGRFQPYVLGGIGYTEADVDRSTVNDFDESEFSWRVGVGMDVYVLEMLPLFIELANTWPSSDLDDLEYFTGSVGAYFRF